MRIHHLNCGTMDGGRIVAHVLVVERPDGLLLVDSGFGTADVRERWARLGQYARLLRPRLDEAETAVRQLAALGFSASDVKRIVCTHLDLDHSGGLADFPHAEVHVMKDELDAATTNRSSLKERVRYRPSHFAHGPKWVTHGAGGDRWHGFASVRPLGDESIALVPLAGHTRGHTAVAIDSGDGWMLHCGDAYFYKGQLDEPPTCPARLELAQRMNDTDRAVPVANQARLRALHHDEPAIRMFCAHDPDELLAARALPLQKEARASTLG